MWTVCTDYLFEILLCSAMLNCSLSDLPFGGHLPPTSCPAALFPSQVAGLSFDQELPGSLQLRWHQCPAHPPPTPGKLGTLYDLGRTG